MLRDIKKSLWLLLFAVVLVCGIYPAFLWVVGQTFWPFQANGSIVNGPDGKPVGSLQIAQPFTKDEYFWPRPSAASYDGTASSSSALAVSNYALRDRVARQIGPIALYAAGPESGKPVAPDEEAWFRHDRFQGQPGIVAQWADMHNELAQGWVTGDPTHTAYVADWAKAHPDLVAAFVKANPGTPNPAASDLAVTFFEQYSKEHPGTFPSSVTQAGPDGKSVTSIQPVASGSDIQSIFFDMWLTDHPQAHLQKIPGDYLTTSGSGLDPDITLENAQYQLPRVAAKWAQDLKRDPASVQREIAAMLQTDAFSPGYGLFGVPMINVLKINLALRKRYGAPS
jgi:potassium-transporting ATPase KdpC subunit